MKAVLFRTGSGSIPVHSSIVSGSPLVTISVPDSPGGVFSGGRSSCSSPRISLHLEPKQRGIRRVSSESDVFRSAIEQSGESKALRKLGSRSFSSIPEEVFAAESETASSVLGSIGSLTFREDPRSFAGSWTERGIPEEELGFPGGGIGKNWKTGGPGGGSSGGDDYSSGGSADQRRNLGAYYQEMLKSNPTDSLLLRNYGKYLHEVERDMEKAEEYYGRAILASPGDGEVLSLYGKLIWEMEKDESRAKCYFDQAVHASPDDCMVLGSYAHFMWETEEDEEEEEEEEAAAAADSRFAGAAMVGAY